MKFNKVKEPKSGKKITYKDLRTKSNQETLTFEDLVEKINKIKN